MSLYCQDDYATLYHGDCIQVMRGMPADSIDSIVTDPPYGLGFMGKKWDALPPGEEWARECLRVLKPGGHLLAFGGSRTWHRLAVAIEDGGFEIRDSIAWMHGQGFPKNKATLKPSHEPVVVARKKPKPGEGLLNIDATRVKSGRWPANVILDEHMAEVLDEQVPVARSSGHINRSVSENSADKIQFLSGTPHATPGVNTYNDKGGASRFFKVAEADEHGGISPYFPRDFDPPFKYAPKAPKRDRPVVDGVAHPTVKPLDLMRWLVRLVTPEGGTVLDSFAGSGTTLEAAALEGFNSIGIEAEADYLPLIQARLDRIPAA